MPEGTKIHGRVVCKLITEITRTVKETEYSAPKPAFLSNLTRTQEMTWESEKSRGNVVEIKGMKPTTRRSDEKVRPEK